jgi:3'-phosphoadenosine 5'-phosphosulfate sulfotransferase (PAPS reductase)/FAD synthetase
MSVEITIKGGDVASLFRTASKLHKPPRFVINSSYGNDSCALIQLAHEEKLDGVAVVYADTKWGAPWWEPRVTKMEAWVRSLGFSAHHIDTIGFVNLAKQRKGFPSQQFQFCSYELKIKALASWMDDNDPARQACIMVGVRREESASRKAWPEARLKDLNNGGRVLLAPLATFSTADRDALLARAGIEPLPHRSMECFPCINSNREDLRLLAQDPERVDSIERLETEMGVTSNGKPRTLFRPSRFKGAVGIREVIKWAQSDRGKYVAPEEDDQDCDSGFCGT